MGCEKIPKTCGCDDGLDNRIRNMIDERMRELLPNEFVTDVRITRSSSNIGTYGLRLFVNREGAGNTNTRIVDVGNLSDNIPSIIEAIADKQVLYYDEGSGGFRGASINDALLNAIMIVDVEDIDVESTSVFTRNLETINASGAVDDNTLFTAGNGEGNAVVLGAQALHQEILYWDETNKTWRSRPEVRTGEFAGVFDTLADLNATTAIDGSTAIVKEIGINNGWYARSNGAWVWISPLSQDLTPYQLVSNLTQTISTDPSTYPSGPAVNAGLDTKVSKVTGAGGYVQAYVANGIYQETVRVEQAVAQNAIVRRLGDQIRTALTPVNPPDVTSKDYVDKQDALKVDATTTPLIVYGTDGSGNPLLRKVDSNAIGNTIPFRNANGNIQVAITPTSSYDAVSKQYADAIRTYAESVNSTSEARDTYLDGKIDANTTSIVNLGNAVLKRVWAFEREGGAKDLGASFFVDGLRNRDLREGDIVFLHIHRGPYRLIATGVWSEATMTMLFPFEAGMELGTISYIARVRVDPINSDGNRHIFKAEVAQVTSVGDTSWRNESPGVFSLMYVYRMRFWGGY